MILYFSGTGNSRHIARIVSKITEDNILSINELLKSNSSEELRTEKLLVFITPTYAWRMPKVVESFIRRSKFSGNNKAYFILTCGADIGNAISYIKNICNEKNLEFMGVKSLVMPDNYIVMYNPSSNDELELRLKKAEGEVNGITKYIVNEEKIGEDRVTLIDKMKSGSINTMFYKMYVSSKGFYTTDKCISCRKCENLCPLNNIKLINGRPQWGEECTHCMACICGCPTEAIEYKKNTKNRKRYYLK